jgi:hypothetical protein
VFDDVVKDAYVLELPDDREVAIPDSLGETAQAELGHGSGVVVTFSPDVAEAYPSIRLLLPGDPVFELLVREATPEEVDGLELVCGTKGESGSEVTHENCVENARRSVVVQPVVRDGDQRDIPGETEPIDGVEDAEQTVLNWLSGLPRSK